MDKTYCAICGEPLFVVTSIRCVTGERNTRPIACALYEGVPICLDCYHKEESKKLEIEQAKLAVEKLRMEIAAMKPEQKQAEELRFHGKPLGLWTTIAAEDIRAGDEVEFSTTYRSIYVRPKESRI
jgi:hypothetical protein